MGRQALQAFRLLRQSGFVPDMVLLSSALEQGLFLRDAFPDAFVACFAESLPSDGLAGDGKGLVRHLLQCRQMQQSDLVIRLTAEAENRDQEQRGVMSLPYPVDTDYFSPSLQTGHPARKPGPGFCALPGTRRMSGRCCAWRKSCWRSARAAVWCCCVKARQDGNRWRSLASPCRRGSRSRSASPCRPIGICSARRPSSRPRRQRAFPRRCCWAMSCGVVPVLAGDAPHWPLLQEGGGGLWCGAADLVPTLAGILAQPHQLAELSLAARRTVERHFRGRMSSPGSWPCCIREGTGRVAAWAGRAVRRPEAATRMADGRQETVIFCPLSRKGYDDRRDDHHGS